MWWREFDDRTKFHWVHLYAMFRYEEAEKSARWDAENKFEGVQYDVELATSFEDMVKIIQVIMAFLRAFREVIEVCQDDVCQVMEHVQHGMLKSGFNIF